MDYTASLTMAVGRDASNPVEEILELCYGKVLRVQILFPPGHAGLTYLQIFRHTRQIWPSTPGESFRGDDTFYDFEENYPIYEVPHEVMLRGWNTDDTYSHTIYVKLIMPPLEIWTPITVLPPELPEGMLE